MFLRNLLLNEKNEIHSRNLHISGLWEMGKVDIGSAKVDIGAEKAYELLRQALLIQRKVVKSVPKMKLDENELNMAKMLIENMIKSLEPAAFQDEYQARLRGRFTRRYRDRNLSQRIPAARPM